jgi:hypothetical protein
MAEKGAWDEEVFKTSFTSFWRKPDRTRPLWEEKVVFSFQGGLVLSIYLNERR